MPKGVYDSLDCNIGSRCLCSKVELEIQKSGSIYVKMFQGGKHFLFMVHSVLGKHHQVSETQNVIASDKAAEIPVAHEHEHNHDHTQLHAYIGVSLVLGFVFMLLVDQIGSSHVHSTDGKWLQGFLGSAINLQFRKSQMIE